VQAAIDGRKPDFAAYVEPQKAKADIIIQAIAALTARRCCRLRAAAVAATPPPRSRRSWRRTLALRSRRPPARRSCLRT
jgi:hypothetical protein